MGKSLAENIGQVNKARRAELRPLPIFKRVQAFNVTHLERQSSLNDN